MQFGLGFSLWLVAASLDQTTSFVPLAPPNGDGMIRHAAFVPHLQALIYSPSEDGGAPKYTVVEISGDDDGVKEMSPQEQQVAQLLSANVGALARLACAHASPPGLELDSIESVSIIGLTAQQFDIQAVVGTGGENAATLLIPVAFPTWIDDLEDTAAIESHFRDLDQKARQILKDRKRQAAGDEAREQARVDLMDERTLTQFPEWWVPARDLRQDCDAIRDLLNGADFDKEVQALAQSGVNYYQSSSQDKWLVEQAVVTVVGSAGLYMRARAVSSGAGASRNEVFDLPLQFATIASNAEDLRSAVLQTIASTSSEAPPPQDDRQRQWEELLVLDTSSCMLPDWWTDPLEPLVADCLYAQQMLNQPEYQQGLRDLVLAGIGCSEHKWVVDMAAVAAISPTGMYLRARCLDYDREVVETINVPVPFQTMVQDVESLRAAVMSTVSPSTTTVVEEETVMDGSDEGTKPQIPVTQLPEKEQLNGDVSTTESLSEAETDQTTVAEFKADATESPPSSIEEVAAEATIDSIDDEEPIASPDVVELSMQDAETDNIKQPVAFVRETVKSDDVEDDDLAPQNMDDVIVSLDLEKEVDSSIASLEIDEGDEDQEDSSEETEKLLASQTPQISAEETEEEIVEATQALLSSEEVATDSQQTEDYLQSASVITPSGSTKQFSRRPIRVESGFQVIFRQILEAFAADSKEK